jgi:NAD(P)-dependent dehydrogenase (short-subunit alcohol dehydrogenase family)
VLLLGGYGAFGRHIADQLAGTGKLVIAGRSAARGRSFADSIGAEFVTCDLNDSESVLRPVAEAGLVINAAGPFRPGAYSIPRLCIEQGCHYIDLADGRQYVTEVTGLDQAARASGVFVCSGASTTPAVTSALAAHLAQGASGVRSIRIALTAGNKNTPGVSTFASILSYAGADIRVWRNSHWVQAPGWGEAEFVEFPTIGRRRIQLCDVPDLDLFPHRFGAEEVTFKAGVELLLFNYGLAALSGLRMIWPGLKLEKLAGPLVRISRLFKGLGSYSGSVAVWLVGQDGETRSAALAAHRDGPRIPTSPAVLLARKFLAGNPPPSGAYPCAGLLDLAELTDYLSPYGILLFEGDERGWFI